MLKRGGHSEGNGICYMFGGIWWNVTWTVLLFQWWIVWLLRIKFEM
ncbi:MAG: hypothetical protein ACTS44_01390 [Candidatus Hodgkinia cicadicola]